MTAPAAGLFGREASVRPVVAVGGVGMSNHWKHCRLACWILKACTPENHGISFAARQRWFQQEQLVDARPGESLVVGFLVCGRHLFPVPGAFFYVQVDLWAMLGVACNSIYFISCDLDHGMSGHMDISGLIFKMF